MLSANGLLPTTHCKVPSLRGNLVSNQRMQAKAASATPRLVEGLGELLPGTRYRALLLDQYGTDEEKTFLSEHARSSPIRKLGRAMLSCMRMCTGVLHDGKKPYAGAVAAVAAAYAQGLQLYIISNSSRRAAGTISKLAKMGFNSSHFTGAVTSGELAHRELSTRPDQWWEGLGHRCIHTTWSSRGSISLEGLGLQVGLFFRDVFLWM
eukprot:scaffold20836_cov17-Tisochrysis_lutea.AAC.1